jgi:hypothetical protein
MSIGLVVGGFEASQAQAPTGGTALGDHRGPLPVLPQPARETAARAPNRGACAVVRAGLGFQPRPVADRGVFEDARVMRTWGLRRDWLERDPRSGGRRPRCLGVDSWVGINMVLGNRGNPTFMADCPSASSLFPNVHICPLVRCASRRTGHWQLPLIIAWVDYKDARDRRRAKQSERA